MFQRKFDQKIRKSKKFAFVVGLASVELNLNHCTTQGGYVVPPDNRKNLL